MARGEEKLAFGKGTAFVKSRLKRLRQEKDTWVADFQALPKSVTQSGTDYLGMVVNEDRGVLAYLQVEARPTVNDLATLLTHAMQRPLTEVPHRPRRLHVRGHPQWRELFPHLEELGIEVSVQRELPGVEEAYKDHLQQDRDDRRTTLFEPTVEQAAVEQIFPAIAMWVRGYGHIEIGDQQSFGFVVRAFDYGGLVFEDDKAETLVEAMATLEKGLADYYERERIE